MNTQRVLALSYTYTQQTGRVMDRICIELERVGHQVEMQRIEPVEPMPLPIPPGRFLRNNLRLWAGVNMKPELRRLELRGSDYDYVLLGFQTWHLEPSYPINSFLDSNMAQILAGRKVIAVQTCRNRWKRALSIVRHKIERRGGQLMDAFILSNPPGHLLPTLHYLFNARDPEPGTPIYHLCSRPFAFDEQKLAEATRYGRELAERLAVGRLPRTERDRVLEDEKDPAVWRHHHGVPRAAVR